MRSCLLLALAVTMAMLAGCAPVAQPVATAVPPATLAAPAAQPTAVTPATAAPTAAPPTAAPAPTTAPTVAPAPTTAPYAAPAPTTAPYAAPSATSAPPPATSAPPAPGATVKVAISNFSFGTPLTIKTGTTVVWTNNDTAPHTATADNGEFDSGSLDKGGSFSFTFTRPGTYPYYCVFHGGPGGVGMASTIVVQP